MGRCNTKVLAGDRGHALVSSRRMPSPGPGDDERVRAHRLQMTQRLRSFALYWLMTSAVWVALLVVQSHLGLVYAALILAGEFVTLATAFRLVGRAPDGRRVPVVLVVTSVVLGASVTILYATMHSDGAFLAFILLTLYLACAIFFSWGLVLELIVLGGTVLV